MAAPTLTTTPLLHTASVVADFRAIDEGELSVKAGTTLMLLHAETDGWALVRTFRGRKGYVPLRYLRDVIRPVRAAAPAVGGEPTRAPLPPPRSTEQAGARVEQEAGSAPRRQVLQLQGEAAAVTDAAVPPRQAQQTPQGEAAVPDAAAAVTDAAAAPDAAAVREATRKAIKERVALVAAMPEADRAAIGAQYTEAEGLFKAIEGIVMLRGSWLKEQSSKSGFRLPKRGDELPAGAIITVDELRAIHKASWCRFGALPVVTVSQCAKQRSNARPPDRALATAARVHNQSLPRVLSRIAATGAQRRTRTPTARRSTSSSARSKRCGASLRRRR